MNANQAKKLLQAGKVEDSLKYTFMKHPRYAEKVMEIGGHIEKIIIDKGPTGPGSCFYMVGPSGRVDISLKKCTNNESYNMIKERETYRDAIMDQKFTFKNQAVPECVLCGSRSDLHVDHIIEFCDLVKAFKQSGESDFAGYHQRHAQLRMLCKRCNQMRFTKT
jgi:hypothetical protein